MALIRLRAVNKVYQMGTMTVEALRPLDLDVERGDFVAKGPRACKSTPANILAA
jgi:ABC-type lipoprotein export system ATPase subunit